MTSSELIERLQDPSPAVQQAVWPELRKWARSDTVTTAERVELLRITATPALNSDDTISGRLHGAGAIFNALLGRAAPDFAPVIVELFPRLGKWGREGALALLADCDDSRSMQALVDLARHDPAALGVGVFVRLPKRAQYSDLFSPLLLEIGLAGLQGAEGAGATHALQVLASLAKQSERVREQIIGAAAPLVEAFRQIYPVIQAAQRDNGLAWRWEEEYRARQRVAATLLELFGVLPIETVQEELHRATGLQDPALALGAIVSLLTAHQVVEPAAVERVAAQAETRNRLWEALNGFERLDLFPPRHATQEAFAESALVEWLTFPTELNSAPEEIQLEKKIAVASKKYQRLYYYVFQFRTLPPHWAAERGWLKGFAGPYPLGAPPSPRALGSSFSKFEAWKTMTAEEIILDFIRSRQPPKA